MLYLYQKTLSPKSLDDLRAISFLRVFAKLFEKIIAKKCPAFKLKISYCHHVNMDLEKIIPLN